MAQQTFNGGMYIPEPVFSGAQTFNPAENSTTIDAASEGAAMIFQAPVTGTIDRIAFRVRAHTSAATLDVRLETVDGATGSPSGTLVGSASGTQLTSAADTTHVVTLGSGGSVTRGTFYAAKVAQPASSPGNCSIQYWDMGLSALDIGRHRLCYYRDFTGGAWSTTGSGTGKRAPSMAVRYSDGNWYYIPGAFPASAVAKTTFASSNQRGTKITLPFPYTVTGFFFLGACSAQDYTVDLYTSDQTLRATFSGDKDVMVGYTGNYGGLHVGYFDATYAVAANTALYLMLTPSGGTNVMLEELTLLDTGTTAMMGMFNGGTNIITATRNGGAFTDDATKRPVCMGLIISGAADDAGGGGGGGGVVLLNPRR